MACEVHPDLVIELKHTNTEYQSLPSMRYKIVGAIQSERGTQNLPSMKVHPLAERCKSKGNELPRNFRFASRG